MLIMAVICAHVYALKCIEYSCKSAFQDFKPGQCVASSQSDESFNTSISLSICNDLYFNYCPPILVDAYCQLPPQSPTTNIAYIGEPCNFDENCVDSICVEGTCFGLDVKSSCQSDFQCNTGLYCDGVCTEQVELGMNCDGVCTEQVDLGDTCKRDEECLNSLTCLSGKCSKYLSVDPYSVIDECEDGINYQCSTGGCFVYNNVKYCLPQVKSTNKGSEYCLFDSDCSVPLNDGKITSYNTQCKCSQNGYATMTCSLAPGDSVFLNYIKQLKNWIKSSEISLCHTTQRLSINCIKSKWDYKNYITFAYFQEYALNYSSYKYSDSCVQTIYQSYFKSLSLAFKSLDDTSDESSDFGGILTSLSIFILVN